MPVQNPCWLQAISGPTIASLATLQAPGGGNPWRTDWTWLKQARDISIKGPRPFSPPISSGRPSPRRAPIIYTAFGGNGSPGIDRVRWLIAIAVAAVLVIIASAITARSRTRAL